MAEWKAQINFNYSESFQTFSYNFMCQGSEQNQVNNLTSWMEPSLADLCNFSPSQNDFPSAAAASNSPEVAQSPELHAQNYDSDLGQYQNTEQFYFDEFEAARLIMTGQAGENEDRRAGSESASDTEPQTSPDSWSSGSGLDGGLPQADPAMWAHKTLLDDQTISTSPDSTEDIPVVKVEPRSYCIIGNDSSNNTAAPEEAPVIAPTTQSINKGKVRAAFSEAQMNVLTHRFNVQRYLTPAEMKNMAEHTGLTYKQVKTWFQNRRMKLRRHQKDNSWASERYTLNKDNVGPGAAALPSPSPHMQPYQGQARPVTPHMIEAALKTAGPQNLALYLAALGGPSGSAGFPSWPNTAPQNMVPGRPQIPGWPLPHDAPQYGYNPRFTPQSFNIAPDAGFKEGEPVARGPLNPIIAHGAAQ